ncbi:gamma-glutamyltranspeptidase [Brevibacillus reuszeri]|uniref:Glutathione hydrolase proenzyme n=1 Tax=Brevibacillus reuszeri TaxID=54915 RepID=A0ABQ0TSI4_9BACL|nr:gamma-glutamyltransferase [Brevibacillus reuszeri]MED1860345.1 gamma-glutamyltransferase [Brevibacillus reuszeri]GED70769.1 gamma-glutamyltranspeptidase [Brevibacillus reuszeri]GIO05660.1 gamma-glutamyltransferase [Brevibacillus reuszeri]
MTMPGIDPSMEKATQGIVSVSHPLAAEAGIKILQQGGNAVDAAAAIQFSLNVVEPYMSGIGGGGYMMVYLKDQNKIIALDGRETAGMNANPDFHLDEDGKPLSFFEFTTSGHAPGTPGLLRLVEESLQKYGTMNLADVLDSAIEQAEQGIEVNWATERYTANEVRRIQKYEATEQVFMPGNESIREGDRLVQPDLAKTLRLIKEHGAKVLYEGEVGEALAREVQKHGGRLTMADLRAYTVKEAEPIRAPYRGYEIVSMGPSSSGGITMIQMLKLLEPYDLQSMGHLSADYMHHLLEAMHLSYADRAKHMADEDFCPVPKAGLLHPDYLSERTRLINPEEATKHVEPGEPWVYESDASRRPAATEDGGRDETMTQTTHFSVIDQWGNMVSFTSSIGSVYGSGMMVPGYGFLLGNHGVAFQTEAGSVNQIEPGKRGLSSMSPTFVLKDNEPFMALGSPGATTIIASVAQVILGVIDFGLPIQQAILAPRVYSSTYPRVEWEYGIEPDVLRALVAKGHAFEATPQPYIGDVHAVLYDAATKSMYGGTDDTREGTVLGVDGVRFTISKPPEQPQMEKGLHDLLGSTTPDKSGDSATQGYYKYDQESITR